MFAELCGGVRPWGHHLELTKPLLIVLFCWPQCVNSCCRMEMTYLLGQVTAERERERAETLRNETVQLTDAVENTIVSTGYIENTSVFSGQTWLYSSLC